MIYELNHFGIFNRDMEKTLEFYRALDAQIVFDKTIAGPNVRIVYLQLAEGMIEFICHPAPPAGWTYGIDHLAFMSDDLDADYSRLVAAGATKAEAPKPAGTGVGRISFLNIGDARVELLERDVDFRRPPLEGSLVIDFDHYALTTPDLPASAAFFTEELGLEPVAQLDVDGTPIRRFLGVKSDVLGLGATGTEKAPGAFPYFTLRVDDVDAALATLAERGLKDLPAAEDSRSGTGRSALVTDPDGVVIELLDRAALSSSTFPQNALTA
jgi:catechol 2,3-dioxygenase-like lactoylglutathione lyase family enzyme